ncbi:phosphotransferase [Nocardioides sp.]|uniref:phosphotransferase family protein n=1 Tax=Nocardioides sp. TaxID=35761 RepID=UPI0026373CCF|nr:phosphotransferase [Nocardioides sp.]
MSDHTTDHTTSHTTGHPPEAALGLDLEPLEGGWSGRTFLGKVAGERTVVRVYPPDDVAGPARDAAVLRLGRSVLTGCAPVPEVLETRAGDPAVGAPGLLLAEHLPGERGDLLLPRLDDRALAVVGRALGEVVARLAGAVQPRVGRFVDEQLGLAPWEPPWDAESLVDLVAALAPRLDLRAADHDAVLGLAGDADDVLQDAAREGPGAVLVHGDLNAKNLLLASTEDDRVVVTGVLDWEFAHAGSPWADLGNLLREQRSPAYVEAVLDTVADRRGVPVDLALDLARAADLVAVVELATRRGSNPVSDAAHERLLVLARARDLHAC